MYKIAILGCENSHANTFLDFIYNKKTVTDVEVIGVYSNEPETAKNLSEKFGVTVAESYDAFVGQVDGIIITARDGKNHLKYALPYIESGIPMFIDKPITNSEEDAVTLMKKLKASGNKFSGGSSVPLSPSIVKLAKTVKENEIGKVFGGYFRAPINLVNSYGGFYFYSQHLVEMALTVFGYYPKSVKTYQNGKVVTALLRYESYDVSLQFTEESWKYYAYVSGENGIEGGELDISTIFEDEFMAYYNILKGGEQTKTYSDFIAPVFVINALKRSLENGTDETVNTIGEI